ncbi:2-oxo acid dehydrogenase subunit E2 [Stappia taiwanensis]|uniref:Dihydrolipoamide acetyltransferase component of pyruvate dehydrogenase complex n=1 Tax=Stappia taiwanensis TaxID=992267 RepID=A0A838XHL5_9HYPH|nr:dihydrolipoamide acetyltransferase family protein [Stappia taiwanensis]MBA4610085.1 2-oxo acid dehydrogenase subunit E2 [Stappia taiwanensis]GGE76790.1 dihydrolipoamide acetyltransferase component of pyruvate dehydrogenase complex [Stappia taiwanensis]
MGIYTITLPDVGEGIAEAELTEWNVAIGDHVEEDDVLGTVMTDKAAVEVPSTVSGTVAWLCGEPGDFIPIGGKFIQIEVEGPGNADKVAAAPAAKAEAPAPASQPPEAEAPPVTEAPPEPTSSVPVEAKPTETAPPPAQTGAPAAAPRSRPLAIGEKPLAAPSVRRRAQERGIDLRLLTGSGPEGRILHEDLDAWAEQSSGSAGTAPRRIARPPATGTREIKVVGMRRKIAEKMALAKARIPHITIVEEVDVTALEDLRASLNARHGAARGKLTLLPFVMRAIVTAVRDQPEINAHYDDEAGVVRQFDGVHIGIATQTGAGLTVPVARHVETHGLWDSAGELTRLAEAARSGAATREELSGSTITITSLGPLGAIATTPIINHPEVAIVGINKMAVRPLWDGQAFQPRKMMNISCAFDHRVIDGWDAAVFVQALKKLLETPALMFIEE